MTVVPVMRWTKDPEKLQKIIELTEEFQRKIAS